MNRRALVAGIFLAGLGAGTVGLLDTQAQTLPRGWSRPTTGTRSIDDAAPLTMPANLPVGFFRRGDVRLRSKVVRVVDVQQILHASADHERFIYTRHAGMTGEILDSGATEPIVTWRREMTTGIATQPQAMRESPQEKMFMYLAERDRNRAVVSPRGDRVAYARLLGQNRVVAVIDGRPGKEYLEIEQFTFSPDGQRLAYCAKVEKEKWVVVLDGKEGPQFSEVPLRDLGRRQSPLQFSANSQSLAYIVADWTRRSLCDSGPGKFVIKDGQEANTVACRISNLELSPDGKRVAFVFAEKSGDQDRVMLDGKAGMPHQKILDESLTFSPDSKRLVYVATENPTTQFTLYEGNRAGPRHDFIFPEGIRFLSDGRAAYQAGDRARDGVYGPFGANIPNQGTVWLSRIYDASEGKELPPQPLQQVASADGRTRLAVVKTNIKGEEQGPQLAITYNDVRIPLRGEPRFLQLSPSGKHYAHVLEHRSGGWPLVVIYVDGVAYETLFNGHVLSLRFVGEDQLRAAILGQGNVRIVQFTIAPVSRVTSAPGVVPRGSPAAERLVAVAREAGKDLSLPSCTGRHFLPAAAMIFASYGDKAAALATFDRTVAEYHQSAAAEQAWRGSDGPRPATIEELRVALLLDIALGELRKADREAARRTAEEAWVALKELEGVETVEMQHIVQAVARLFAKLGDARGVDKTMALSTDESSARNQFGVAPAKLTWLTLKLEAGDLAGAKTFVPSLSEPQRPWAYIILGEALLAANDKPGALAAFQAASNTTGQASPQPNLTLSGKQRITAPMGIYQSGGMPAIKAWATDPKTTNHYPLAAVICKLLRDSVQTKAPIQDADAMIALITPGTFVSNAVNMTTPLDYWPRDKTPENRAALAALARLLNAQQQLDSLQHFGAVFRLQRAIGDDAGARQTATLAAAALAQRRVQGNHHDGNTRGIKDMTTVAQWLQQTGDNAGAIERVQDALKNWPHEPVQMASYPDTLRGLETLAEVLREAKARDFAALTKIVEAARSAGNENQRSPSLLPAAARIYALIGEPDNAAKILADIAPGNPAARDNRGPAAHLLIDAWVKVGAAHWRAGKKDAAITAFSRADEIYKGAIRTGERLYTSPRERGNNTAWSLAIAEIAQLGDIGAAAEMARTRCGSKLSGEGATHLAHAQAKANDIKGVCETVRMAIADGEINNAYERLSFVYEAVTILANAGKYKEAAEVQAAASIGNTAGVVRDDILLVAVRAGDVDFVTRHLNPWALNRLRELVQLRLDAGDDDGAKKILNRAVELSFARKEPAEASASAQQHIALFYEAGFYADGLALITVLRESFKAGTPGPDGRMRAATAGAALIPQQVRAGQIDDVLNWIKTLDVESSRHLTQLALSTLVSTDSLSGFPRSPDRAEPLKRRSK